MMSGMAKWLTPLLFIPLNNISFIQGYFIDTPMPASTVTFDRTYRQHLSFAVPVPNWTDEPLNVSDNE
jgi:hypothetical protein